jgi:hypothetical protein
MKNYSSYFYVFLSLCTIEAAIMASDQESSHVDQIEKENAYKQAMIQQAKKIADYIKETQKVIEAQQCEAEELGFSSTHAYNNFLFEKSAANFQKQLEITASPYTRPSQNSQRSYANTQREDRAIKLEEEERRKFELELEKVRKFNIHLYQIIIEELKKRNSDKEMNWPEKELFMNNCRTIAHKTCDSYHL